jgi:hypothetical protein
MSQGEEYEVNQVFEGCILSLGPTISFSKGCLLIGWNGLGDQMDVHNVFFSPNSLTCVLSEISQNISLGHFPNRLPIMLLLRTTSAPGMQLFFCA